jgi:SAM-dependent methyltransferase
MMIDYFKNRFSALDLDQYYVTRDTGATDYEESYWGLALDPDGVERSMSSPTERDNKRHLAAKELAIINSLPPGRILDVGCGNGAILEGVDARWEKYGVEISHYAVKEAQGFGNIHEGDLRSACYDSSSYDVILLFHVIEHMTDPLAEVSEIYRILKNDGLLIIGTPDFDCACARRYGDHFRLLHDKTHISLFSNDSLTRMLADVGFQVIHTDFPFFETKYFTSENLLKLFDCGKTSPPFYGNIMTKYCKKLTREQLSKRIQRLSEIQKNTFK